MRRDRPCKSLCTLHSKCYKTRLSSLLLCSSRTPRIKSFLRALCLDVASLTHQSPRPIPNNALHHPFVPYQGSQSFSPRFSRKVPRAVRIQPLVHHPLARPHIFHLSEHMIWVIRVGRRRYSGAVVQDITPTLPAGEENAVFEFRTSLRRDRPPSYRPRLALLCRGWIEGSCSGRDEGVQVLVDRVVDCRS